VHCVRVYCVKRIVLIVLILKCFNNSTFFYVLCINLDIKVLNVKLIYYYFV